VSGFRDDERGRLIMACGTGKTLIALWIAEKLDSRRTLVLVPSLSLISQTMTEWGRNAAQAFDHLVVCSDETVANRTEDTAVTSTRELGVKAASKRHRVRGFGTAVRRRPSMDVGPSACARFVQT